jgi:hypothetical protein
VGVEGLDLSLPFVAGVAPSAGREVMSFSSVDNENLQNWFLVIGNIFRTTLKLNYLFVFLKMPRFCHRLTSDRIQVFYHSSSFSVVWQIITWFMKPSEVGWPSIDHPVFQDHCAFCSPGSTSGQSCSMSPLPS